jgi:hypothetical protein
MDQTRAAQYKDIKKENATDFGMRHVKSVQFRDNP